MRTALLLLCLPFTALAQPANNDCAGAILLTSAYNCANTGGTVVGSTVSAGTATCGTIRYDVWYRFVAKSVSPVITLSNVGANFTIPRIAVYSGTCAGLTEVSCGASPHYASGTNTELVIGNTYYLRVMSQGTGAVPATNAAFNICIQDNPSGRTGEVFKQNVLVGDNILNDPWEVIYGHDGFLWVTEAKGYKVQRIDPNTGARTEVLNIANGSATSPNAAINCQFTTAQNPFPQGGFAGMAMHPDWNHPTAPKKYMYIGYVYRFDGTATGTNNGHFFTSRIVRFRYNDTTSRLVEPFSLVDSLPGSNDHNSQRMIIAPIAGVDYLFYACGDMGAGQFANTNRAMKAQITASYEGKILRFNLERDADANYYDSWIPSDNPFNGAAQSAVWATGIRNNQGFAYQNVSGTDIIYGTSHGPYSDDELNIIKRGKNYGHPLVIGYANDDNYNNSRAGTNGGTCPLIVDESNNAAAFGGTYEDVIFSAYAPNAATINNIYNTNPPNSGWPSEGWSGLDIYTSSYVPGWKNSLLAACLKWGRVMRLKLNASGTGIDQINGSDTVSFFGGRNRFRDIAISPDGKEVFVIMDKNATSSGPSANNPTVPVCAGCLQKYTFQGYYNNSATNKSSLPTWIGVSNTTLNTCVPATTVVIDNAVGNTEMWVPITGPDGNIIAEINARGNQLGTVTSSVYRNGGAVRENAAFALYLDRNITINVATQPSTPVSIRLYLTPAELTALMGATNSLGQGSGVSGINSINILKNSDACSDEQMGTLIQVTPQYREAFGSNYVIQGDISSFSTFYLGRATTGTLPIEMVDFTAVKNEMDVDLKWETQSEQNASHFEIERSLNGVEYSQIGKVAATGNSTSTKNYKYTDVNAASQSAYRIFYRLKMMDLDGSFTYSKIATVQFDANVQIQVYPNPVRNTDLTVKIGTGTPATFLIQVTDQLGRVLHSQQSPVSGISTLNIPVKSFTSGVYLVNITNVITGKTVTEKFEKQ